MRVRSVAALSFVFTYLFFFEYLPPFRWVDVPHDLEYYHYPLDDFAFRAVKAGHIPEWDPTLYCGLSFVGNPQTALFYPPLWLTFAANLGRSRLGYRSLEILVIAHYWLAFLFCFLWLRHKRFKTLACVLGAGVFAYSGYMLLQLQHLGLVCGYAWLPVGLWSIDEAAESRGWPPLWKLSAASALCFLAGYPPASAVFGVCMLSYAAFQNMRLRMILWTAASLAFSYLIAMVQLLPAWEAMALKAVTPGWGGGVARRDFYFSYLIPNFFNFGLRTPQYTNPGGEYLYLGAPAFLGLLWLASHRQAFRGQAPVIAIGLVSLLFVNDPFHLIWAVIQHSDLLSQVLRSWYFLVGITLSVAGLAAAGLDHLLRRELRVPRWLAPLVLVVWCIWLVRQLWIWRAGSSGFASGWRGAVDPLVMLALFSLAILALLGEKGHRRAWIAAAVIIATGVDYKVFGTSKRVNAVEANIDRMFSRELFPGMEEAVYRQLRDHSEFRLGLDENDPVSMDLRHYGLTTPQGGDPMVSSQYLRVVPVMNNDGFLMLDPAKQDLLQLLAVRYFLTTTSQPLFPRLKTDPDFHQLGTGMYYFRVFEFSKPKLPYRWERESPGDSIRKVGWAAETRDFVVRSESGGRFVLIEQFFPGWQAAIDDRAVPVERWTNAFQSISVPPGEHRISFTYRSSGLRRGALISAVSLLMLGFVALRARINRVRDPMLRAISAA